MTDKSDKYLTGSSDLALMKSIGAFIKHHRLLQNKSQDQLAREAGIVRSTLSLFEQGGNTSMEVFIRLLRALKLLQLLQEFQVKPQISPLQLARLEKSKRLRAGRSGKNDPKPASDW
jgi:transcriptional regulator with XRE-family HTH domain